MFAPHLEYLKKLINQGKLIITGPFLDGDGGGMLIVDVENETELNSIIKNDPAVINHLTRCDYRPYSIFLQK